MGTCLKLAAALATFFGARASQELCNATVTPIHEVQGSAGESPLVGETVTVRGIVTVVLARAFFIQARPPAALCVRTSAK